MKLHFQKQHFRFLAISLCFLWMLHCYVTKDGLGLYRLDGIADAVLPANFRLMTDGWHRPAEGKEPTREGLDSLHMSGSAEPSQAGMKVLYDKLRQTAPERAELYMIDCRQETHFYVEGCSVSWHTPGNMANKKRAPERIVMDIDQRMADLKGEKTTFIPLGGDERHFAEMTVVPAELASEERVAEAAGFHYVHLFATDGQWPGPGVIDKFIEMLQGLPDNYWLHFHCLAGQGRTTTFMCLYDIWMNPFVPVEDVVRRQYLLGGMNLFDEESSDVGYREIQQKRRAMIPLFQKYVLALKSGDTSQAWSDWLEIQERPLNMRRNER